MAAVLSGVMAGAFVVVISARAHPGVPARSLEPLPAERPGSPVAALGRRLLRLVGRRAPSPLTSRRVGWIALAAIVALVVFPPAAMAVIGAAWLRARMQHLRERRSLEREVARSLPEAVDLLLLCCGAGLALPLAHPLVADHLAPPIGPALRAAHTTASAGEPRADALVAELSRLGDRAAALAHLLADHLHYGVALAPGLERLGLELRLDRRRRAEQDARRVPVRLLAPLVTCVLPAFGLLTVVPLLAASLDALPT